MSEQPEALGSAQSLRRGLAMRIGSALIVLFALVALALMHGPTTQGPASAKLPAAKLEPAPPVVGPSSPRPAGQGAGDADAGAPPGSAQANGQRAAAKETVDGAAAGGEPRTVAPADSQDSPQVAAEENMGAGSSTGDTGLPSASAMTQAAGRPLVPGPPPGAGKPPRGTYLQAGVFMQPGNAQAFKNSLAAQGLPVFVESRVHVGPFKDRKEAERVREQLRESGVTTVVVSQ